MDRYGVAFSTNSREEPVYDSNCPQVCACASEEEAISVAREYSKYLHCKYITPFRNLSERSQVNWLYIKKNRIVI